MSKIINNQNETNNEFNPAISANEAEITNKEKTLPLLERMVILREEINALDHRTESNTTGVIIGKVKQQYGNCIFWYKQWDKNRDYSSVVNATLALGKMSSLIDLFPFAVPNNLAMNELLESMDSIFRECWKNIQEAAGRIVPFEEN